MKLVAVDLARVTRFFQADEVRPQGGTYVPDLIKLIVDRYAFAIPPMPKDALGEGLKFKTGRLARGANQINIIELGVFNDGIMASVFDNTDNANLILDDFAAWLFDTLKISPPQTKLPRWYFSGLIVEFDAAVVKQLAPFTRTMSAITGAYRETYPWSYAAHFSRLGFSADPTTVHPLFKPEFFIERRIGVPYEQSRFFCSASLPTKMHLQVLEQLEAEAKDRRE